MNRTTAPVSASRPSGHAPPVALTIAGSDNSAGAGAQADLKTFTALGVYGLTVITCVVAEVPGMVSAIQPVESDIVARQIRLSFGAFPVAAVKTGMLYSREIIETVCDVWERLPSAQRPPLVVDPVMVATSGDDLLREDAVEFYKTRLFPKATLVTPNLDEARKLVGYPIDDLDTMKRAGRELTQTFGCAWLLKGGHLRGANAEDLLFMDDEVLSFTAPFVPGVSTHGTGCTYAAAITAGLASGLLLGEAVARAKTYVTQTIAQHFRWGDGVDALNHTVVL